MTGTYINPATKLALNSDRVIPLLHDDELVPPVNVEIDLSNRCGLGCQWCHFAGTHTRGPLVKLHTGPKLSTGDLLDTDLARKLAREFGLIGVRSVTWTGGGEPSTHPDALSIFREFHEHGLAQGIYTNAQTVNPALIEFMKQKFSWIYVSLDSSNREDYATVKNVGSAVFERQIIPNIRRLVQAEGAATVGLGFLLSPDNLHQIESMVTLGRELGADYTQFRPIISFDEEEPGLLPGDDRSWLNEAYLSLVEYQDDPDIEVDFQRFDEYHSWVGHRYTTCYWSGLQTVVTPDGQVWTCVNKRGFANESLGNLHSEEFRVLWGRRKLAQVNKYCRVMCRGHMSNLILNQLAESPPKHREFI